MFIVQLQIIELAQNILNELVSRAHGFESRERNRVHDAGLVRVESDDVLDAEFCELLKNVGTVKRLAAVPQLLPAFIEVGHDDVDAVCFAAGSGNDSLQILVMVVRRHDIIKTCHRIGQTVIAHVDEDVKILATDRLLDRTLAFSRTEAGSGGLHDKGVEGIIICIIHTFGLYALFSPVNEKSVDLCTDLLGALQRDNAEFSVSSCAVKRLFLRIGRPFFHVFPPRSFFCMRMSSPISLMMV